MDSKGIEGQEVPTGSCSGPRNPEDLETAKEDPQATNTTENNNSIMSFLKTLVSGCCPFFPQSDCSKVVLIPRIIYICYCIGGDHDGAAGTLENRDRTCFARELGHMELSVMEPLELGTVV